MDKSLPPPPFILPQHECILQFPDRRPVTCCWINPTCLDFQGSLSLQCSGWSSADRWTGSQESASRTPFPLKLGWGEAREREGGSSPVADLARAHRHGRDPGHCDGVKGVKVAHNVKVRPLSSVNLELASCRREAMTVPGCRGHARGCVGEVRPGHGDGKVA